MNNKIQGIFHLLIVSSIILFSSCSDDEGSSEVTPSASFSTLIDIVITDTVDVNKNGIPYSISGYINPDLIISSGTEDAITDEYRLDLLDNGSVIDSKTIIPSTSLSDTLNFSYQSTGQSSNLSVQLWDGQSLITSSSFPSSSFESKSFDETVNIYLVKAPYFISTSDTNGDGYFTSAKIAFDFDIQTEVTKELEVKSYFLYNGEKKFEFSKNFNITGISTEDSILLEVGGVYGPAFDFRGKGIYTFEVYNGTELINKLSISENYGVETNAIEARNYRLSSNNFSFDGTKDQDNDSYPSVRTTQFDILTSTDEVTIFAALMHKTTSETEYSLTTLLGGSAQSSNNLFSLRGFEVISNDLDSNTYDFKILILESTNEWFDSEKYTSIKDKNGQTVAVGVIVEEITKDGLTLAEQSLGDLKMETASEDK